MFCFTNLRKMVIVAVVWLFLGTGTMFGNDVKNSGETLSYTIGYAKFAKGTCTEYVASRRKDLFPSYNGKDRLFGGNAISWATKAKKLGIPTNKIPEVGAIAVFGQGRGTNSAYGHVAIVEKIIDHNTIVVSDMNYAGHNEVTRRTISSTLALGYIHTLHPPIDDKQPEIITSISIQLSLGSLEPQTSAGSLVEGDTLGSAVLTSDTIIYTTPLSSTPLSDNNSDTKIQEMSMVADNRYIMKYMSQKVNNIEPLYTEQIV